MYFLYSLVLALGMLLLMPWFLYRAVRYRRYLAGRWWRERWGYLPEGLVPPGESSIWIHGVSVGEVLAVVPLARRIKELFPELRLLISTVTPTGQETARARLGGPEQAPPPTGQAGSERGAADGFFYFPFDWTGPVRRALRRANPRLVIIAETEIWPNFLRETARAGIPVLFVNSRISDRSFGRYQKVKWFTRSVLAFPAAILTQTEEDRRKLAELGAPEERVRPIGNLKYDLAEPPVTWLVEELSHGIARHGREPVLIAGSTMPGEEEIVGAAFAELQRRFPRALWILAPRHPERFDAVTEWVLRRGWRLLRRSEIAPSSAADLDWPEVFLVDSMGELAGLYRLATVAYVGGSLVARGGHNPLEPALFARPIVFGPSMENFREMAQALVQENAAVVVNDAKELETVLRELSADEAKRERMGQAGRAFVERHRGATHHAIGAIQEILAARPGAPTLPVTRQTLNHRGSGQAGVRS